MPPPRTAIRCLVMGAEYSGAAYAPQHQRPGASCHRREPDARDCDSRWPWASYQSWDNLLTCHWPIDPAVLRPKVPVSSKSTRLTVRHGLPSFRCSWARSGSGIWAIPTESNFPEINFRTYVRYGGRAGVYFFHVDAEALLVDIGARLFFHTPYEPASCSSTRPATAASASRVTGSWRRIRRSRPSTGPRHAGCRSARVTPRVHVGDTRALQKRRAARSCAAI